MEPDGKVLAAHCTCMAGVGEACSHIAALLFSIVAMVQVMDSKTDAGKGLLAFTHLCEGS